MLYRTQESSALEAKYSCQILAQSFVHELVNLIKHVSQHELWGSNRCSLSTCSYSLTMLSCASLITFIWYSSGKLQGELFIILKIWLCKESEGQDEDRYLNS